MITWAICWVIAKSAMEGPVGILLVLAMMLDAIIFSTGILAAASVWRACP